MVNNYKRITYKITSTHTKSIFNGVFVGDWSMPTRNILGMHKREYRHWDGDLLNQKIKKMKLKLYDVLQYEDCIITVTSEKFVPKVIIDKNKAIPVNSLWI